MATVLSYWLSGGTVLFLLALVMAAMIYLTLDAGSRHATLQSRHGHIALLCILITASPLLGLFGTITGMIHTFRAVSLDMHAITPEIAAGISTALITTQAGLTVALLGIALRTFLSAFQPNRSAPSHLWKSAGIGENTESSPSQVG